jgi:predicted DNA-binding transcriptional regulator AlpA|tara:strand:+ start:1764 stop:1952 length:189 start_codon:yes stop_codon:yes gene_type:complete
MEKDNYFPNKRVITANELMTMLSISSTTLWRHVRDDRLPKPSYVGKSRYWVYDEVMQYIFKN